jgi:hypothetical protein
MSIGYQSRIVVSSAFCFAEEGRQNFTVGVAVERQAVVASSSGPPLCISACFAHHFEVLELDQMKAKQVRRNLPLLYAKRTKIFGNDTGEYFAEIALERI